MTHLPKYAHVKVGDLVQVHALGSPGHCRGLAIEVNVNMWGEEVTPSGVRVFWTDGDISVMYEDEVEVIDETCVD